MTERQRDRLMVELQLKNKELEGIVYVASHDLRSPLVNIQGFSRKLGKSCTQLDQLIAPCDMGNEERQQLDRILREAIPKSLGFITSSVEKMDGLLKGLLRLSRLGRAALCFETLDMTSIMEKIVSSMAYQIDTLGARIELGELGPCMADAGQVIQVFSNLLDNALKYHSPDRPLVVRIYSEEFDEGIRYCVEDNGIGIPRDQQDVIWEIFHRLNPDDSQGEGLGLTMARRIVARLGGSIWVEPAPEAGSCFYVVLPKPPSAE
jgi:signal transduction histidine kinase